MRDPAPGALRVGDGLTVQLGRAWSDFTPGGARKLRLLSQHGPTLDRLYLVGGLQAGEGMTRRATGAALYAANATDDALIDFIAASVDALGFAAPTITLRRPAPFGDAHGLRCNIETATGDGLAFSGAALIAQRDSRLSAILYLAAREHYFAAGLPDVEAIMASAKLADQSGKVGR